MKIAIIGSGFFGLAIAFELSKYKNIVDIFEKENDILQGASKKNQLRFHLGYHYPRSQETVNEVKKSNKLFINFYSNKVLGNTKNFYAVSKNNSKISLNKYLNFARKNKLYLKKTNEKFNNEKTSNFYLTHEKNLNYFKFKKNIKKKLNNISNINIFTQKSFSKNFLKNYDKVIVCCYSNNNTILKKLGIKKLQKIRYELVEKIIVKLPLKYKNKSYIVLDGNFACLDPYLGTDFHLLSDVKFSKIEVIKDIFPKFSHYKKKFISKGIIKNKKFSNYEDFINNSAKYIPVLRSCKYKGSFFVVRAISNSKKSKLNDERLSYITKHSKKVISVLAGKWNTSISISKKLRGIVNEK